MYPSALKTGILLASLAYLNRRCIYNDLKTVDADIPRIKDKFKALRDKYQPPKYPIVLCHGLLGFDSLVLLQFPNQGQTESDARAIAEKERKGLLLSYWLGIEDALTKAGATVITAKVPAFGSIEDRAAELDKLLSAKCKELGKGERVKVNLVGHSMGGLDCRYLIAKVQNEESPYEVVSLTTVSTPHRGSECADFVMNIVHKDPALELLCPKAIPELTTDALKTFNKEVPNKPNVAYFSYGALMPLEVFRVFRPTYEIIKRAILKKGGKDFDNDGMVSVESAQWGKYLGTIEGVDHLDLINWTNKLKAVVDAYVLQQEPTFSAIALYLDIAESLSKHGY